MSRCYTFFLKRFRPARMRLFAEKMKPASDTTILDVGGTTFNWLYYPGSIPKVTLLNITPPPREGEGVNKFEYVKADATALPYADASFDIVFSNSLIEHLGTIERQRMFAREAVRVGKRVWVQTPNKYFFVEPHLVTPLLHYLPKHWQRLMIRFFSVWGLFYHPSREEVNTFLDEIRLLSVREMAEMFPRCMIVRERFMGMTKSIIAFTESLISGKKSYA